MATSTQRADLEDTIRAHFGQKPMPPAAYTKSKPACVIQGRTRCPSYSDCLLCGGAVNFDDPSYKKQLWEYQLRLGRWNNRFRHDERIPYPVIVAVYFRCDGCCEYEDCEHPHGTASRDMHHLTYERAYGFERPEDLMLMHPSCHKEWHRTHGVPR